MRRAIVLYLVLASCCALTLALPSDAPFINDDAMLLNKALRANQQHRLETIGLLGSQGYRYGPLPVWMYQGMLAVSHDPRVLIVLHAAAFTGIIAASLVSLSRTLRLPAWFAVTVVLSPYVFFYARLLWDNSWCIPFSCALLAGYARFLDRPARVPLVLIIGLSTALTLTHLMSAVLVVPVIVHLLIARRRELSRQYVAVIVTIVVCAAATTSYAYALFNGSIHGATVTKSTAPSGWWFPLLGGRVLSGANLGYLFGDAWCGNAVMRLAWFVSLIAYPLVWIGVIAAARKVVAVIRAGSWTVRDHIAVVCLAALLSQVLLDGALHVFGHPHYYNGAWIIFPFFAWLAVDAIAKQNDRIAYIVVATNSVALAALTLGLVIFIHTHHGVRNFGYGPTLGNQIEVVRDLNAAGQYGPFLFVTPDGRYPHELYTSQVQPTKVPTDVRNYLFFPHAASVLQELRGEVVMQSGSNPVAVRYASDDPDDARVMVVPAHD